MNLDLFEPSPDTDTQLADGQLLYVEPIGQQSVLLRQLATRHQQELIIAMEQIVAQAPFRHMLTPGGYRMSAAMTSCGELGWVTDRQGYCYQPTDPLSGKPWPALPKVFEVLARQAAELAGFAEFKPDSCLMNSYGIGAKMSLHQDKNEQDLRQPVVSVSLGIPATFLWGGFSRKDATQKIPLFHGDVVVWGGVDHLRYHGIASLKPACHPLTGERRINLTFRQAD